MGGQTERASATKRNCSAEEELSDRRSSGGSDSKRNKTDPAKKPRSSKNGSKKKWQDDYDTLDRLSASDSDQDWSEKMADGSSSDSDPGWSPKRHAKSSGGSPLKSKVTSQKMQTVNSKAHQPTTINHPENEETSTTEIPTFPPDGVRGCKSFAGFSIISLTALERCFDSGKFIMAKSDYKTQKAPCIWRIDGKNLLQKYELVKRNEGVAYRNISTYSSWSMNNKGMYVPIDVSLTVQSTKSETIVTFDSSKVLLPVGSEMMESLNEEATSMIDTFQIYLQTLISQALDSNFLSEISKENDEYFLTSMAAVEDHWILPKREQLKDITKTGKPFQDLLDVYPELEIRVVTSGDKKCEVCACKNPIRSFDFLPTTYNYETLATVPCKPPSKSYRCCLGCTDRVLLYHQLYHIRYHLFVHCRAKIAEYDQADGPAALKACLADQQWKSLMHRQVLLLLAEAQQTVANYQPTAATS